MRSTSFPFAASGLLGVVALGAALVLPALADAAPQTVKEIANYTGADRQSILEAGAKKEGEVMVYTTGTQTGPIMEAFRKKYPFINLKVYRATSSAVARRVLEEYSANRYSVDTFNLSTGALRAIRDAGILMPYSSPEFEKIGKEFFEAKHHWAHNFHSSIGLGFNTKQVSPEEAPKTYEDLLDPKWKGKMALSGRPTTLGNFTGILVLTKGEDFVRKLGKQDIPVYKMSGRALSNMVVSGEVALSPEVYNSHMKNSKRKGASVDWRALGPVFGNIGASALPKKPPHPHGAMLFIDFMLSRDGQQMMQKLGYVSPRIDLVNRDRPKELIDLYSRPNYPTEIEKWLKLANKSFGKLKPNPHPKKKKKKK